MKTSFKMMLAAGAMGVAGLVATAPVTTAAAQGFALSFNVGNVAFGYTDGYYDNNRRWHKWRSTRERDWYRKNHGGSYHAMRHDRDRYRNNRWNDWNRNRNRH